MVEMDYEDRIDTLQDEIQDLTSRLEEVTEDRDDKALQIERMTVRHEEIVNALHTLDLEVHSKI